MRKRTAGGLFLFLFGTAVQSDAPARVPLVRVCEVLKDLNTWRGKAVAVVGRYSFRENGRFLSETACESKLTSGAFTWPASLRLSLDSKEGPKLPESFDIDGSAAERQIRLVRKATNLGKFRFGSLEYDRWAIVYGRVEPAREYESPPPALKSGREGLEPAPALLFYRGDGLIFFISGE